MTDILSPEQRSYLMAKIHCRDTTIEKKVCSALHRKGFRFRKNVKKLPGTPDIVLRKYKAVIFINGCFWHGHSGCRMSRLPNTKRIYWENKRIANLERDARKINDLVNLGWRVAVVWQCALEKVEIFNYNIQQLETWLKSCHKLIILPLEI